MESLSDKKGWYTMSLPTRGGWIEIEIVVCIAGKPAVPPHTGRVD